MTFLDMFQRAASRFPERLAIKDPREEFRYKDVDQASQGLAAFLRSVLGLEKGDRVGILLDSSARYVIAYLGTLRAGCVAVPLNTDNSRENLHYVLADCSISALVGDSRYLSRYGLWDRSWLQEHAELPVVYTGQPGSSAPPSGCYSWSDATTIPVESGRPPLNPDDLACVLYTSGTTGRPKGVMLSHGNLAANTESIIQYLELGHDDSIMAVLPFFYSYGSSLFHTHLAVGGTVHIETRFVYPNKVLERMAEEKVSGFAGVPSTFALLLYRSNFSKMKWPHLRYVTQAGGAMAPALVRELDRVLPNTRIFIMYGQTEATARLSYLPPERLKDKIGSVGKAIPGVELRVVAENGEDVEPGQTGEILARGANVMQGYWGLDRETQDALRDGWLHTGDLATVDGEGFIYIISRKSELIKSGAHRISPKEIEEVILENTGVSEVAVVGWPDPILGEKIVGFLVPRDGAELNHGQILRQCRSRLASFKVPHELINVDELPKTTSGKVKKFLLKPGVCDHGMTRS